MRFETFANRCAHLLIREWNKNENENFDWSSRYFFFFSLTRRKTHDRSIARLYLDRTTIARTSVSYSRRLFLPSRGGTTGPETFGTHVLYALSVSCPVYFWRFANSWTLLPPLLSGSARPDDVIPWNHRGGVFSCVRDRPARRTHCP